MLGIGENYGSELEMLLQLEITYADGQVQTIGTDSQFRYAPSPYIYSDLLIGERYDARLEDLREEGKKAVVKERGYEMLLADCAEPVRPVASLEPAAILQTPKGETVVDFGQNFAGVVQFTVHNAPAGTEIRLEHSEVLDKEGNFIHCVDGFNRDQTDIYICRGGETETCCPQFTFHGFRYAKITGYPGKPEKQNVRGIVIGSDLATTGELRTSDPRLNQLQSNIFWSQRSNLLSIPMDCPQRERAGWTGDVWVCAETCCYNQDCLRFFKRWLKSVRDEQFEDGLIPIVTPYIKGYRAPQMSAWGTHTSAGWGDVIVWLPWVLYQVSRVLHKPEEAACYEYLNRHIRQAFAEEYIDDDGKVEQDLQGLYVLALAMDLAPQEQKSKVAAHLARKIKENCNCLDTGFISIKFLMDVLTQNGLHEQARQILFQEAPPSWLYEVKQGTTTIWETWTSILPDGTPTNYSYNHYAFGCVGDWMYRNLLGIQKLSPGYQEILIKPDLRFGLSDIEGSFRSVYGKISVHLQKIGEEWTVQIQTPANTTAWLERPGMERVRLGNGTFVSHFADDSDS